MDKLDRFQRRFRVTAFAYAVQKKFGDDRGGYMAALITYYGFLSIFPLLLAAFTVVAYALAGDHHTIVTLERHIGNYPIIGPAATQLEGKSLKGSPLALVAGVLGLVWGAMGLAQAAQFTMNQAWNVANRDRPGFLPRLRRGLLWYGTFGIGIVASTFVTSLGSVFDWTGGSVFSALLALVLNVALFTVSFRVLAPAAVRLTSLLPGAVLSGVVWTVLTGVGVGLASKLAHSNALYGTFAPILALLAFLYLMARITIYGIEACVVHDQHLWPRALTKKNLCPADLTQLENLAQREAKVEGQAVKVEF